MIECRPGKCRSFRVALGEEYRCSSVSRDGNTIPSQDADDCGDARGRRARRGGAERALREREREVVRKLQEWAAAEPNCLEIRYTRSFNAKPGYWNLVLHSLRERLGTQTVSGRYDHGHRKEQAIPGEILAQCSDLQDVSVYCRVDVDLSQLTHAKNVRRLDSAWMLSGGHYTARGDAPA